MLVRANEIVARLMQPRNDDILSFVLFCFVLQDSGMVEMLNQETLAPRLV